MYDIQKQRHFVSQIDSQQGSFQNKHTKYKYFKGHKNVSSLLYNPTAMKLSSENKANERKKNYSWGCSLQLNDNGENL